MAPRTSMQPAFDAEPYRLVLEAIPDAALLVDPQGLIVYANAAAVTVMGYGQTPLAGTRLRDHVAARHRTRHSLIEGTGGQPGRDRLEISIVRKDATELNVELTISPL